MNSKEYIELIQAYQSVYEQQIGVPTNNPDATLRKIIKSDPKYGGGEVVPLKPTKSANLEKAHYEPEGEQLQEKPGDGYLGPTPIPNPIRLAQDAVDATNRATQRRVDTVNKVLPGSASMPKTTYFNKGPSAASQKYLGLKNSYEPEGELIEDIEERRKQLARASREGIEGFKERISARVRANKKRLAKKREREQLKSEIKSELAREAVGDPISPSSVYKLSDPKVQQNLRSTMKPSGPAPIKPTAQKPKQQSYADKFVKRVVGGTSLSPI